MITKYQEEIYLTGNVKFGRCVCFFFFSLPFFILEYVFFFCLAKFFFFFPMNRDFSFKSRRTK